MFFAMNWYNKMQLTPQPVCTRIAPHIALARLA